MSWFSFAIALLSVVKTILEMVERRKAEKSAEAAVLRKMIEEAHERLKGVGEASILVRGRAQRGELSDDDFRD